MAERRPLVVIGGITQELPAGDTLPGGGGGGGAAEVSLYQYRIASSTNGVNVSAGSWDDVPLDTEVHDGISGSSLASEIVTLPAGTYLAEYWANLHPGSVAGTAIEAQCRLYDNDAASEISDSGSSVIRLLGVGGSTTVGATLHSQGACKFTLASETDVKFQVRATATIEIGESSTFTDQVAAQLMITKL